MQEYEQPLWYILPEIRDPKQFQVETKPGQVKRMRDVRPTRSHQQISRPHENPLLETWVDPRALRASIRTVAVVGLSEHHYDFAEHARGMFYFQKEICAKSGRPLANGVVRVRLMNSPQDYIRHGASARALMFCSVDRPDEGILWDVCKRVRQDIKSGLDIVTCYGFLKTELTLRDLGLQPDENVLRKSPPASAPTKAPVAQLG